MADTRYQSLLALASKMSKVDFPRLAGIRLMEWLDRCEHFFYLNNTAPEFKVPLACLHMEGKALQWHLTYMRNRYYLLPTWLEYMIDISNGLGTSFVDPRSDLDGLQQTASTLPMHYPKFHQTPFYPTSPPYKAFNTSNIKQPPDICRNQPPALNNNLPICLTQHLTQVQPPDPLVSVWTEEKVTPPYPAVTTKPTHFCAEGFEGDYVVTDFGKDKESLRETFDSLDEAFDVCILDARQNASEVLGLFLPPPKPPDVLLNVDVQEVEPEDASADSSDQPPIEDSLTRVSPMLDGDFRHIAETFLDNSSYPTVICQPSNKASKDTLPVFEKLALPCKVTDIPRNKYDNSFKDLSVDIPSVILLAGMSLMEPEVPIGVWCSGEPPWPPDITPNLRCLNLVKVLIESENLPLHIPMEMLQKHKPLTVTRQHLVIKCIVLLQLIAENKEAYTKYLWTLWLWIIVPMDLSALDDLAIGLVEVRYDISCLVAKMDSHLTTKEDLNPESGGSLVERLLVSVIWLWSQIKYFWDVARSKLGYTDDDRMRQLQEHRAELETELGAFKEVRALGAGITFFMFKDVYTANKSIQDFRNDKKRRIWKFFSPLELQLARNKWKVERAPLATDIYWNHLRLTKLSLRVRRGLVNSCLVLMLLFFNSSLAIISALKSAGRIINAGALDNAQLWLTWIESSSWAATLVFQIHPNVHLTIAQGGHVLIQAFALGGTQQLLLILLNYTLTRSSQMNRLTIVQILAQEKEGKEQSTATNGYDFSGSSNFLKVLGYFNMVDLRRVHYLLGDYQTSMEFLQPIDFCQQGIYTSFIGSQIATIYHYEFATLMLRRYVDGIHKFNKRLSHIYEPKQYHQRSSHYAQILQKNNQRYALLAIYTSLCPQVNLVASMEWSEFTTSIGLSSQGLRVAIIQHLYCVVEDPVNGHTHAGMMRDKPRTFRRPTYLVPKRIILYRNGVSEGHFSFNLNRATLQQHAILLAKFKFKAEAPTCIELMNGRCFAWKRRNGAAVKVVATSGHITRRTKLHGTSPKISSSLFKLYILEDKDVAKGGVLLQGFM